MVEWVSTLSVQAGTLSVQALKRVRAVYALRTQSGGLRMLRFGFDFSLGSVACDLVGSPECRSLD